MMMEGVSVDVFNGVPVVVAGRIPEAGVTPTSGYLDIRPHGERWSRCHAVLRA
jgi:hypothetical protein